MATYMYTSATGSNWDDDDEESEAHVYQEAAAEPPAASSLADSRLALQTLSSGADEEQQESIHLCATTAARSQTNQTIDPDWILSFVDRAVQHWHSDHHRRPAYVALSCEYGFVHPSQRRNYSTNWKATKLRMGGSVRNTVMMMPSPLRLCKTWTRDSAGGFIEDRDCVGCLSLLETRIYTPRLGPGNEEEEEREELRTLPETPPMAQAGDCEAGVGEYDPTTGAVGLLGCNVEVMKTRVAHELVDLASIAGHSDSNEAAICGLVATNNARSIRTSTTTTIEAELATPSFAEEMSITTAAAYGQLSHSKDDTSISPADSVCFTTTTISSLHLASRHDRTNSPLVWNVVAAGWFGLSSLPWGRMAIAAAGALVDVVTFVVRS